MPPRRDRHRRRSPVRSWFGLLLLALAPGVMAQQPVPAPTPAASPEVPPTIHMIGDSTMANKLLRVPNPERGWGQLLPLYFQDGVRVVNHAVNGRSTKSFRDRGHWQAVLDSLRPGEYLLIQFGHNDAKREDPARFADAWSDYKANLERYVTEARSRGAQPVLATPIVRRHFDAAGGLLDRHGEYPKVVRDVATRMAVPLLELHDRSRELVLRLGPERSEQLYLSRILPGEFERLPDGIRDDTHLSAIGASRICDLAAAELRQHVPELARWLRE